MRVAGLLNPEQLDAVFLNVEELVAANEALTAALGEAIEAAVEDDDDDGDDDLCGVEIGRIFLEREGEMLAAFKSYCTRQVKNTLRSFEHWLKCPPH